MLPGQRPSAAWLVAAVLVVGGTAPAAAATDVPAVATPKAPVAEGTGGAVATVDADATQVGIDVLAAGGNAVDAAVATAAALGVVEPYSAGIGGGGYLLAYDAGSGETTVLDGRETAPASFDERSLLGPDGSPLPTAEVISSGLSVGVPGTPALWERAAEQLGTRPLAELLAPAEQLALRGFVVDATYAEQTAANAERFARFPETARVYLPGGRAPEVGSVVTNPDLARAYRELARHGADAVYDGALGDAIVDAAQAPRTAAGVTVFPGQITADDLAGYQVQETDPVRSAYHGLELVGVGPSSSGGTTVGEALAVLDAIDTQTGTATQDVDDAQYLHRFAEASAIGFADRGRWVGDVPDVPVSALVSGAFAAERACAVFDPAVVAPRPISPGDPTTGAPGGCPTAGVQLTADATEHGTTHLTVVDAAGDVVSYTLTIEQTGGSGITVPGYGFLLNNELTDFDPQPVTAGVPDPNLPGPGKRPRSSIAPTIVLDDGRPVLALGSPGGATIITTVAQVLAGHYGRGLSLPEAVAAPRISSRNTTTEVESSLAGSPSGQALAVMGHELTTVPEIGAATAIAIGPDGQLQAVAEPTRRGGGAAAVVDP